MLTEVNRGSPSLLTNSSRALRFSHPLQQAMWHPRLQQQLWQVLLGWQVSSQSMEWQAEALEQAQWASPEWWQQEQELQLEEP